MFARTVSVKRNVSEKTDRDRAAQVDEAEVAQVDAVDRHAALVGVVEAREQPRDGALACAGLADERQRRARFDLERQVRRARAAPRS